MCRVPSVKCVCVCVNLHEVERIPLTSPLLLADVGQAEHGEESDLVLQLGRAVHLLRGEARAELAGG